MKHYFDIYASIYTFSFLAIGVFMPLLGQYLAGVGFTGTEIGVITAAGTAVGIVMNPVWGVRYSRSRDGRRVLALLYLGAAAVALLLPVVRAYPAFLLCYGAMFLFQGSVSGLLDTMTVQSGRAFGTARMWGALSYAAGCLLAGVLAEALGMAVIFPLYSGAYLLSAGIVACIIMRFPVGGGAAAQPIEQGTAEGPDPASGTGKFSFLRKNRRLAALVFSAFFLCGTNVANNTYFGFLYREGGGTVAGIGVAMLLMCCSEAPVMALTQRLSARFTLERVVLAAMCLSVLRFLWYGTGPSAGALLATFFLQGFVNGIILVEFVRYIARLTEGKNLAVAMSLYTAISCNCGAIACQLAGGLLLESLGAGGVYLFFAAFNLVGVLLYLLSGLYRPHPADQL